MPHHIANAYPSIKRRKLLEAQRAVFQRWLLKKAVAKRAAV